MLKGTVGSSPTLSAMRKNNKKKSDQLGMPFGTAMHRLRKQIMFFLAEEAGLTSCHRCGEWIETAEEFSIEHKKPWLDNDPELFWDLNNIAFSHLKCNIQHAKHVQSERTKCPEGYSWCSSCQTCVSDELFGKAQRGNHKRKLRWKCNPCRKKDGWEH